MEKYFEIIKQLQKSLHECPELAFDEIKTKEIIYSFLKNETDLEVVHNDSWIYAKYEGSSGRKIAFRADFDAVCGKDGNPGHYCGHDGHSAILLGFAKYVSDIKPDDTVYLIFQPAEEVGQGGKICAELLKEEGIEEVYGFHNIPGFKQGTVLILDGTFACASTGLEIKLHGKPTHAAYPEDGINPAVAVSNIILKMNEIVNASHRGMLLGTVIGVDLGSNAYGVSASEAIVRLTLRGEYQDEFENLVSGMKECAIAESDKCGLSVELEEIERFPATINHPESVDTLRKAAADTGLETIEISDPFRWSEDFGYYLMETKGAFFGVGDGEDYPQLHTESYVFPIEIAESVLKMYIGLL